MKKTFALLLCLTMLFSCGALAEDAAPERTVAAYEYAVTEEGAYVENLIFNADVIISGDASQIVFSNCEFNGDIILTSELGTKVMLFGCDVNGVCIAANEVTDIDLNYNNPKFLTDTPVNVVSESGIVSVVAIGDFEFSLNGETYSMASVEFFSDASGIVPYEGQEADYCIVGQYYENGEKSLIVLAEKE